MSYLVGHFRECVTHHDIGGMLQSPAAEVLKAHGGEEPTDWRGGFVIRLQDGTFAYSEGWCDYTGWG